MAKGGGSLAGQMKNAEAAAVAMGGAAKKNREKKGGKKRSKSVNGHIPFAILEKRAVKLVSLVEKRRAAEG